MPLLPHLKSCNEIGKIQEFNTQKKIITCMNTAICLSVVIFMSLCTYLRSVVSLLLSINLYQLCVKLVPIPRKEYKVIICVNEL